MQKWLLGNAKYMMKLNMLEIFKKLPQRLQPWFRQSREAMFGAKLEEVSLLTLGCPYSVRPSSCQHATSLVPSQSSSLSCQYLLNASLEVRARPVPGPLLSAAQQHEVHNPHNVCAACSFLLQPLQDGDHPCVTCCAPSMSEVTRANARKLQPAKAVMGGPWHQKVRKESPVAWSSPVPGLARAQFVASDSARPEVVAEFRAALEPLRATLSEFAWLGGKEGPNYADMYVMSFFLVSILFLVSTHSQRPTTPRDMPWEGCSLYGAQGAAACNTTPHAWRPDHIPAAVEHAKLLLQMPPGTCPEQGISMHMCTHSLWQPKHEGLQ